MNFPPAAGPDVHLDVCCSSIGVRQCDHWTIFMHCVQAKWKLNFMNNRAAWVGRSLSCVTALSHCRPAQTSSAWQALNTCMVTAMLWTLALATPQLWSCLLSVSNASALSIRLSLSHPHALYRATCSRSPLCADVVCITTAHLQPSGSLPPVVDPLARLVLALLDVVCGPCMAQHVSTLDSAGPGMPSCSVLGCMFVARPRQVYMVDPENAWII